MDQFSYLSVLLSIIVGLAITQILQGFRGIVLARSQVRMYWPTILWALLLLIVNVQSWWAMFSLREIVQWTLPFFSIVLAQTIGQYMLSGIVFPDFATDNPVDLRAHYLAHTRWFFILFIVTMLFSLSKGLVNGHVAMRGIDIAFHGFVIASSVLAILIKAEVLHKALPVVGILVFLAYTAALFTTLR